MYILQLLPYFVYSLEAIKLLILKSNIITFFMSMISSVYVKKVHIQNKQKNHKKQSVHFNTRRMLTPKYVMLNFAKRNDVA